MTEESNTELHTIVHGYVQGVGFRATTLQLANQLGLSGTVRNLPDGSVEILAQGSKDKLEKLMQSLKSKMAGRIDSVSENYSVPTQSYKNFRIIN